MKIWQVSKPGNGLGRRGDDDGGDDMFQKMVGAAIQGANNVVVGAAAAAATSDIAPDQKAGSHVVESKQNSPGARKAGIANPESESVPGATGVADLSVETAHEANIASKQASVLTPTPNVMVVDPTNRVTLGKAAARTEQVVPSQVAAAVVASDTSPLAPKRGKSSSNAAEARRQSKRITPAKAANK